MSLAFKWLTIKWEQYIKIAKLKLKSEYANIVR